MPLASFQAALQNFYYGQCLRQLASVVASLEIIGNPRGFAAHVSTGCIEMCCVPYQGAMQSPEDMLEGMVLGTCSCFSHGFFGLFNSLSKVAGAVSQGCLLCLNEDQHQVTSLQPQNMVQGLRFGTASMADALRDGCTGLISAPARGLQRGGVPAAIRGAGQGLAGCLVSPLVGCCEMTRHTSEGIRNYFISKDERHRIRPPRMLYGPQRIMRPYSFPDAELKALLFRLDASLGSLALVDCAWDPMGVSVAVISESLFIFVSKETKEVKEAKETKESREGKETKDQRPFFLKLPLRDVMEECQRRSPAVSGQEACRLWMAGRPVLRTADVRLRHAVGQMLNSALGT